MDHTVISAVVKAALRERVAALSKTLLNAQKAAAAGNKERAGKEAVAAAQAAQASGDKFLVLHVEVPGSPKAPVLPSDRQKTIGATSLRQQTRGMWQWLRLHSSVPCESLRVGCTLQTLYACRW